MDVKLSGIVEMLAIPLAFLKFHICMPFPVVFMDIQINKVGCVNYACFSKFSHTYKLNLITIIATSLMCYT